uniref:Glycine-rich protein n=1 Tax=Panagrolaimus superbus TaxID=310955 RepID=A0A914Z3D5_9BILA
MVGRILITFIAFFGYSVNGNGKEMISFLSPVYSSMTIDEHSTTNSNTTAIATLDAASKSNETGLTTSTAVALRKKRQFGGGYGGYGGFGGGGFGGGGFGGGGFGGGFGGGGFGGCCMPMPPICCGGGMPMPIPVPVPVPIPIQPPICCTPMIPPPIVSCCGCCLPVCMPICMRGGCGCGGGGGFGGGMGGFGFGRKKREMILMHRQDTLKHFLK